jgi:hypothetical protein
MTQGLYNSFKINHARKYAKKKLLFVFFIDAINSKKAYPELAEGSLVRLKMSLVL